MSKKNYFTVLGITLSFAIAIGGWFLTSTLIEIKSNRLLSASFSLATNKLDNMSVSFASETPDDTSDDFHFAGQSLTNDEIVSILRNWNADGRETLHEPTVEQLNMEQAIESGREWLSFISNLNIFSDELLYFNNVKAYLFQNIPPGQGEHLHPAYSYWSVTYKNESLNVNMIINAVTGQVWKTEVEIFNVDVNIDNNDITNTLAAFVSALEISDESGEVMPDELTIIPIQDDMNEIVGEMDNVQLFLTTTKNMESLIASYGLANENANAIVMASGWRLEDCKWKISNFKMYLIDKK